jgi:hypothetical protein
LFIEAFSRIHYLNLTQAVAPYNIGIFKIATALNSHFERISISLGFFTEVKKASAA